MNKKVSLAIVVFVVVLTTLACSTAGLVPTATAIPTPTTSAAVVPVSQPVNLADQQDKLIALYQSVNPGVVAILTTNAMGTGWVYNSDGYIVTNQHVVDTETKVEVDFPDGLKVYGNVVGSDANSDLAVVKVDVAAGELHPLALGDSSTLKVGQVVVAIGNPLTLNTTSTMTTGIIAGLGRSEASNAQATGGAYYSAGDFIETDALLNHGNSGGPLLNLDGQVIGVNRSIQLDPNTGLPSGLGYAISVNMVKRVVPSLIQNGKYSYPLLGISAQSNLPLNVIDALGLKSTTGAYVTAVTPGGPADKAGIQAGTQPLVLQGQTTTLKTGGDLIVAVDGHDIFTFDDAIRYMALYKSPGDKMTLTILRGDQKLDVEVTLGTR